MPAYVSVRQCTSAYVSIRQHTYSSVRDLPHVVHYSGRGVKGEDSAGSVREERALEVRVKPHA